MTADVALRTAHEALQAYTLGLGDASFIHQHVVDAWTAQTATAQTKPIALTFALVGLYLHLERGLSGREVQLVHIAMAREKRQWPGFPQPTARGDITPVQVMAAPVGPTRSAAIDAWCAAVWAEYGAARAPLIALLSEYAVAVDRIVAARR